MSDDQHVGYIFSGQFFFDDEPLDYEYFRSQAKKYDFDEEEYIVALNKVPRLSRKAVNTSMAFLMTFANTISQLSYSNYKQARLLSERDLLVNALKESENREHARLEELTAVLDSVPSAVAIGHYSKMLYITGNKLFYEWTRLPEGTNASKNAHGEESFKAFRMLKDGVEIAPQICW